MKADDFNTKTYDELSKMLMDMKKQQFNLRFQKSQGQLENTAQIRVLRRNIARARTFMNSLSKGEAGEVVAVKTKAPAAKKKAAPKSKAADTKKAETKKKPAAKKKSAKGGEKVA
jgi:large subunit ribosomal protein L29